MNNSFPSRSSRVCLFFSRDGFCADGDSCDFQHMLATDASYQNCRFYSTAQGCAYGDRCRYSHIFAAVEGEKVSYATAVGSAHTATETYPLWQQNSTPICRYYKLGNCAYGNSCKYLHETSSAVDSTAVDNSTTDDVDPTDLECGICMNKINGCQIGMLSHCYCLFCLNCIRGWRKDGLEISGPKQVRLCPLCRRESHFTIPTYRYVTDPDKKSEIIRQYQQNLARTPCKYFFEKGNCPFGSSCFYMHVDSFGREIVKETPRLIFAASLTGESNVESVRGLQLSDFLVDKMESASLESKQAKTSRKRK